MSDPTPTPSAPSRRDAAFWAWHTPFMQAALKAPGAERYGTEDWTRMDRLAEKIWCAAWAAALAAVEASTAVMCYRDDHGCACTDRAIAALAETGGQDG